MQQPLLGQILFSRSASKTIFVNRDLFSNYYLGTLLAREVRKHYGETGSRLLVYDDAYSTCGIELRRLLVPARYMGKHDKHCSAQY